MSVLGTGLYRGEKVQHLQPTHTQRETIPLYLSSAFFFFFFCGNFHTICQTACETQRSHAESLTTEALHKPRPTLSTYAPFPPPIEILTLTHDLQAGAPPKHSQCAPEAVPFSLTNITLGNPSKT